MKYIKATVDDIRLSLLNLKSGSQRLCITPLPFGAVSFYEKLTVNEPIKLEFMKTALFIKDFPEINEACIVTLHKCGE